MCLITAVFSSFVNDTPVFCIMLPIVLTWCASGVVAGVIGLLRGADGAASLLVKCNDHCNSCCIIPNCAV